MSFMGTEQIVGDSWIGSIDYDRIYFSQETLHRIEIDENLNEIKYDRIYTGERIRDIIDLGNGSILMSLESTGSFGILENIY